MLPIIEFTGFMSGIAGVWLNTRQNVWGWIAGLLSVSLYSVIFFHSRLYADMTLQLIYIPICIFGCYRWLTERNKNTGAISHLKTSTIIRLVMMGITAIPLTGYILDHYTDSDIPYLDAVTSEVSLAAEWMLAKKILQCWILMMLADISFAAIYFYKELYFTGILYIVFVCLSVYGYHQWRNSTGMSSNNLLMQEV